MKNRMKYISMITASVLIPALLLGACGDSGTNSAANAETGAAPAAEREGAPGQGFYGTLGQCYEIYNDHGVTLELIPARDPDEGNDLYMIRAVNTSDEAITVHMDGFSMNEKTFVNDATYIILDPGEVSYENLSDIPVAMIVMDIDHMDSLEGDLKVSQQWSAENDDPETYYEGRFQIDTGDLEDPRVTWMTLMDARAEEQVLAETDEVRVTLLGLGDFIDDDYQGYLKAIVMLENLTDHKAIVGLDGVAVNGMNLSLMGDSIQWLPAGAATFEKVIVTDLEDSQITSIYDVRFLILTDQSELSGTVNYSGGAWYPVTLSEAGINNDEEITGDPILDAEGVRIYYAARNRIEYNYDRGDDYGDYRYEWELIVVNDSDENVEIYIDHVTVDGAADDNQNVSRGALDNEVGAHSRRRVVLTDYKYKGSNEYPEITFNFQFRSLGGGYIIYTSDEMITLGEP